MKAKAIPVLMLIFFICTTALAQDTSLPGYRGEIMRAIDDPGEKLLSLAEAIPAEKYNWRPAEGVRSVSETLMHVAAANYFIASRLGTPMPEGIDPRNFEAEVTGKDEVIDVLRESFDYLHTVVEATEDASMEEMVEWFGGSEATVRSVLLFLPMHPTEHLGQLIAYARMNDVTPPWSR